MNSKDVLKFLFDKWKAQGKGTTQEEWADYLGRSRPHVNQFMTGQRIPPRSTMKSILLNEGYKPQDFTIDLDVQIPDAIAAKDRYEDMFNNLQTIVTFGGDNRILGIRINLEEFAEGARSRPTAKKKTPKSGAKKGASQRAVKRKDSAAEG